ncbi:unnamed protein product [Arctogadus glacialis]
MFVCSLGAGGAVAAAAGRRGKVSELKAKLQAISSRDLTAQEETRELRGQGSRLRVSQIALWRPVRGAAASAQQREVELEREASERRAKQRRPDRVVQELELQTGRTKLLLQGCSLPQVQSSLQQLQDSLPEILIFCLFIFCKNEYK